jgi:SAM-dependent methyltransferase
MESVKMASYLGNIMRITDLQNRENMLRLMTKNPGKILDLGCAAGDLVVQAGVRSGSSQLYGIELDCEACQYAEAQGVKTCCADLNLPLPLKDESFDIVISNQVIEHLHKTDQFIKETYRVLKPGGTAIVSTPNLAALYHIISLILGWQPITAYVSDEFVVGNPFNPIHNMKRGPETFCHLRIFTPRSLRELFEAHGFKDCRIIGTGYYPFPEAIAKTLARIDGRHAVYITVKATKTKQTLRNKPKYL